MEAVDHDFLCKRDVKLLTHLSLSYAAVSTCWWRRLHDMSELRLLSVLMLTDQHLLSNAHTFLITLSRHQTVKAMK